MSLMKINVIHYSYPLTKSLTKGLLRLRLLHIIWHRCHFLISSPCILELNDMEKIFL